MTNMTAEIKIQLDQMQELSTKVRKTIYITELRLEKKRLEISIVYCPYQNGHILIHQGQIQKKGGSGRLNPLFMEDQSI